MRNETDFRHALHGKNVPILVLDQKWHRLFAVHGKTPEIKALEDEINGLLKEQGKLNSKYKEYKKLKSKLMNSIVENMEETSDSSDESLREKKLEENKRLIDELNDKIDEVETKLMEIPKTIREKNETLMLFSMDYFYSKLRVNTQEAKEIDEWITQVRIDLKKNIIRKQNREINNREIYSYLHDILGPETLDLFDIKYDEDK